MGQETNSGSCPIFCVDLYLLSNVTVRETRFLHTATLRGMGAPSPGFSRRFSLYRL